ncbi:MAG: hypothetical protein FWG55_10360 [Candidatus Bathyarchaeota archaeon]|nr:hypothetical protein [Candidatus Termiticorpusculum sp.]
MSKISLQNIKQLCNGELALRLDHLGTLELSTAQVAKYAGHLLALLHMISTALKTITKSRHQNNNRHYNW